MGAKESSLSSQLEQERMKQYEDSCRYELMRQDLKALASDTKTWQELIFQVKDKRIWMLTILDNLGSLTFNTVMGTEELSLSANKSYPVGPDGKKLKPCCACPETKRARDACIMEKGQEHCTELIEAHKACMRSLGFNI